VEAADARPWSSRPGWLVPAVVTAAMFALLAAFVGHDPAPGVTWSNSPYTDEAWNLLNARNFVVLGRWSVDDWNRHLISIPYSAFHAAVFAATGPGIVQARLVEIAATALTAGVVALGVRRVGGPWPALLAGLAYGTSTLVLYHGRLALLEPITGLGLAVGCVALATGGDRRPNLAGVVAGLGFAVAVGTKAVALPPVAGILAGVLLLAWRRPELRRRWLVSIVSLAAAALAWVVLVLLPNASTVAAVATTLPPQPLPAGVAEALAAVKHFLLDDGVRASLPLLVGGAIGGVAAILGWRSSAPAAQALLLAAGGWTVVGIGVLALVPYSPNRYLEPMLPPLGILVGLGAAAIARRLPSTGRPRATPLLYASALALLTIPGLAAYAAWMRSTPATATEAQATFAELLAPGAAVEGTYAPMFAMRGTGETLSTEFGTNRGDLYETRGVRWLVLSDGEVPAWTALHPDAWAARRPLLDAAWGPHHVTLYVLP
jgi:4-amino-4-deoxy-L-arabinose transferase-like glycosyltransferase